MELLPCPFCGGEALPTAHLTYNWFAPVCRRCNTRGPSVKIERDSDPQEMRNLMNQADENWNRRASPDLASPVLNRIRAEGMRMASTFISLVRNDWASAGDNLSVQAAEYLISALDTRADELENSNG